MMDALTNRIKAIVAGMLAQQGVPRWGIVTAVDPTGPVVKVTMQPDGVASGWLPVKQLAAGPLHVMALPSIGDQVQVHPDAGNGEHGVVAMASHSVQTPPPVSPITNKPVQPGEYGVFIGGVGYLHYTGGAWYMAGDLHVNGNVLATGNVTANAGMSSQVDLLNHDHYYLPGSGSQTTTSPPVAGS